MCGSRGRERGSRPPPPLKHHKTTKLASPRQKSYVHEYLPSQANVIFFLSWKPSFLFNIFWYTVLPPETTVFLNIKSADSNSLYTFHIHITITPPDCT